MQKNIIDGVNKILQSKTSKLSSADIEELKKIKRQARLANTKEKIVELALHIARFFTNNQDFFT